MRSDATGRLVAKTCKSWLCPSCNTWLSSCLRTYLLAGMAEGQIAGHALALWTFTEPPTATLDLPSLMARHERTVKALRRRGLLLEYGTFVELQRRGALHPHIIGWLPKSQVAKIPTPERIRAKQRTREEYGFHFGELVPLARKLGWGSMVDVRLVDDIRGTTGYAVKSLAGYATKEAVRRFKDCGAKRVRPVRASRGWAAGRTLKDFHGEKADPGPWRDVTNLCAQVP